MSFWWRFANWLIAEARHERDEALAEVERLRKALRWIRATADGARGSRTPPLVEIKQRCDAALPSDKLPPDKRDTTERDCAVESYKVGDDGDPS